MSNISKLVYALAFQAGWFVCIMAGNLASILYTALFLIGHLWYLAFKQPKLFQHKEILWVITVFCLGLAVETIYFSAGFLYTDAPKNLFDALLLPPIWLLCIWIMFSLALRTCLSFLFYKPTLSYITCAVFVPLNYYAGAKLNNEVAVNEPYFLSLTLMTFIWILFLWCLIYVKRHYFEEIFNAH
jgi:hypothetical protein